MANFKGFRIDSAPTFKREEKLPHAPLESDLDAFISAMGHRYAPLLQLLKEVWHATGRSLPARLQDFDFMRLTVTLNLSEKGIPCQAIKN